ncbi:GNAT family N-acetyltransferase [Sporosarcina sp. GW1-11]|uniref:GNAT family N-acetyltransferase n=1 Tax=Sporosarcina sp. GW1-11 TaxID=2899126 RepID=UPI00294CE265|nr:GNAT family N-acetyltransferase [Sporosarcina sp. GW1-11]MDV6379164.1 GNAT family N-acetyltransferase [Sporosarcina sp. GW1-11]
MKQALQANLSLLTEEQLPEIMALQETVVAVLEKPEFLQPLTEADYLYILKGNGMMAGAFVDDKLIAFRAMLDPGEDDEHLGVDAEVPTEQLTSVLYSEITGVDPAFRGNGLQTILGKWLMEHVDADRYRYICTTVAPYNIPSLKDKFALGLQVAALKVKYGNKLRYILIKDLEASVQTKAKQEQRVLMSDTEQQQQLLADGWIGQRMEQLDTDWYVVYVK